MAKTKTQKEVIVEEYLQKLEQTQTVFLVNPKGTSSNNSTTLKKEMHKLEGSYNVIKNSLFKVALEKKGLPVPTWLREGEHAAIFIGNKAGEAAKFLKNFAQENETLVIKGGLIDGDEVSAQEVNAFADLPSKEVLLGQLLGVMNGPMRGMVTVLTGNIREFLYALNAIKETKSN